jgi:hypothetical protein
VKRALPYISLTLAFIVAALVVNAVVTQGIREAVGTTGHTSSQAWFSDPVKVDPGVYANRTLDVSVRFGSSHTLRWAVVDAGRTLSSGTVVDTHGRSATLHLSTARSKYHSWFRVYITGLKIPLQVWVI